MTEIVDLNYRGNLMNIHQKKDVKDITRVVFDNPVWKMGAGDPVPDMPLDIQIEVTNVCNLLCEACPYVFSVREKEFFPWDLLKELVDQAAEEGVAYVTLGGIGETMLYRRIFEAVKYIREKKVKPKGLRTIPYMPSVVISNGQWLKGQIEQCLENPPDLISFSLAGLTDDEFLERRKGLNISKFEDLLSRLFHERKFIRDIDGGVAPIIHVSTHIFPAEYETRQDDIARFKERFFGISDAVVVKPTMHGPNYSVDTFGEFSIRPDKFYHGGGMEKHQVVEESAYTRNTPCFEPSRRLAMASNGKVWCGHNNLEGFGDHLGDLTTHSLREVWHGDRMTKFRNQIRSGIFHRSGCQQCGSGPRTETQMQEQHQFVPTSNIQLAA